MFSAEIYDKVNFLLESCRAKGVHISTGESCTGGLIAAALTEISGSSDVFERGFVTYQDQAKIENLGVSQQTLVTYGAVSEPVAREMATGTLNQSQSQVSVAVTGIAGPGGGSPEKPVGLVHIVCCSTEGVSQHRRCEFGEIGRKGIRDATVLEALDMLVQIVAAYPSK